MNVAKSQNLGENWNRLLLPNRLVAIDVILCICIVAESSHLGVTYRVLVIRMTHGKVWDKGHQSPRRWSQETAEWSTRNHVLVGRMLFIASETQPGCQGVDARILLDLEVAMTGVPKLDLWSGTSYHNSIQTILPLRLFLFVLLLIKIVLFIGWQYDK